MIGTVSAALRRVKKGETDGAELNMPLCVSVDSSLWDEGELQVDIGGLSPTLRLFLDSGPHFSAALMALIWSSAVYILRAIAPRERRMLSVCQSVGPSYRGRGAEGGPSS